MNAIVEKVAKALGDAARMNKPQLLTWVDGGEMILARAAIDAYDTACWPERSRQKAEIERLRGVCQELEEIDIENHEVRLKEQITEIKRLREFLSRIRIMSLDPETTLAAIHSEAVVALLKEKADGTRGISETQ